MKGKQIAIVLVSVLIILAGAWMAVERLGSRSKAAENPPQTAPQIPTVPTTSVVSQQLERNLRLPGELKAFEDVAIYPKVQSFVDWIGVDRGSVVKRGQLLVRMSAPEVSSNRSEADARVRAAESQKLEAEAKVRGIKEQQLEAIAKLQSDTGTYKRLKKASETPGVVAGNDVDVAQKTVEADEARVRLLEENQKAAEAQARSYAENEKAVRDAARSTKDIEAYLQITAPFDGVITERNVHPGSLVGPSGTNNQPMLRLQQISHLRLVTPVPESAVGGVAQGVPISFNVPAFPDETFSGIAQRIGQALDPKTRTMPVELDVNNGSGRLKPGMYAEVTWPQKRTESSIFVPPTAIAVTTERTFVVRIKDGTATWVDVKRGVTMGKPGSELVEVFGNLVEGDQIAVRGTDEIRDGAKVNAKPVAQQTK